MWVGVSCLRVRVSCVWVNRVSCVRVRASCMRVRQQCTYLVSTAPERCPPGLLDWKAPSAN